ncbi:polymerase/histidinol phosphatase-like protein [Morchella snyderi]|nr:polymerase/histidinol phosphatase-like protein [Morchella snyderi]
MPFSHHSHSGQFCQHAKDTLEEMVQAAIAKGMIVFSLTEHMPRDCLEDLYPEEIEAHLNPFELFRTFAEYYNTALRLRSRYQHKIELPIGFEVDYIRESSITLINHLQTLYKFDFFIGSVHHVNTIPIDFDKPMYQRAIEAAGGTEKDLFEAYFDAQYKMLKALKPAVVGHFDLIRFFCSDPDKKLADYGRDVVEKVERNVDFICSYGGITELNSSSIRKGWEGPYPKKDVCEIIIAKGGRFTLSDDSHAVDQVGLNYHRVLDYVEEIGLKEVHYLMKLPMGQTRINVLDACVVKTLTLEELKTHQFWQL